MIQFKTYNDIMGEINAVIVKDPKLIRKEIARLDRDICMVDKEIYHAETGREPALIAKSKMVYEEYNEQGELIKMIGICKARDFRNDTK